MSKIEPGSFGGQDGFVGTPTPRPGQRQSDVKPMAFASNPGSANAAMNFVEAMLNRR